MVAVQDMLVVEDLDESRDFLTAALEDVFPGCVVHAASSVGAARDVLQQIPHFRYAWIDLSLPDGSGIDLIREMQVSHPDTPAIVTSVFGDDDNVFGALSAGAQGYVLKGQGARALRIHLDGLAHGVPPLSPSIARRMLEFFRTAPMGLQNPASLVALSPRETEVLSYIGRGLRVAETAQLLGLAESTVAGYVKTLYQKLTISSRAEAALEALKRGLS